MLFATFHEYSGCARLIRRGLTHHLEPADILDKWMMTASGMEEADSSIRMAGTMKESGRMARSMGKAFKSRPVGENTVDYGTRVRRMAQAHSNSRMELCLKHLSVTVNLSIPKG